MKKILFFAAAAAFLAACSSDDLPLDNQPQAQLEEGAVSFDAYMQRTATRGGVAGVLTTNTGTVTLASKGFGVFGYYTDNNEYDQRSTPNFFYNQQVTGSGTPLTWTYNPIKYWPNEYGSNAVSEDNDRVTYFAYAPYVEVVPTSGKLADVRNDAEEWGITSMTRNSNQGDPILKYIASFSKNRSVDLCWGVADYDDGIWPITKDGSSLTIENGTPWLNVERPASTDQKIKFTFKHALAQLRVNIDAVVDQNSNTPSGNADPKTRIWVREVTFKGFTTKGALNLNNGDDEYAPKWLDYGGQNELVADGVTIYDGRKDGKEGVAGAVATNEKVTGLNPILIQDGVYEKTAGADVYISPALHVYGVNVSGVKQENSDYDRAGVTDTPVPLFDQYALAGPDNKNFTTPTPENYPFFVIPTDEDFEIEIVYDVETVSENLAQNLSDGQTKGTSIENRITKTVTFGTKSGETVKRIQPGNSYMLNLHLGLTSVKLDAEVTDWIVVQETDVDLPLNAPKFEAGKPVKPYNVTLPYTGTYTFAITGLNGGESVVTDPATFTSVEMVTSATTANASTSGVAIQTLTPTVNPSTIDRQTTITWTGAQSEKGVKMTFIQKAHPLELSISSAAANGTTITLGRSGDISGNGWFCDADGTELSSNGNPELPDPDHGIAVYRNGSKLLWEAVSGSPSTGSGFIFGDGSGVITIKDELKSNDIIKVVLKTGTAPVETAQFKVL